MDTIDTRYQILDTQQQLIKETGVGKTRTGKPDKDKDSITTGKGQGDDKDMIRTMRG